MQRPLALIKVCPDTLFVEIHDCSPEAEGAVERALAAASIEAGTGSVVLGPFQIRALEPARCYGRVEVKPRGSAPRMCAARDAAVQILTERGYDVFGKLMPPKRRERADADDWGGSTTPLYAARIGEDGNSRRDTIPEPFAAVLADDEPAPEERARRDTLSAFGRSFR